MLRRRYQFYQTKIDPIILKDKLETKPNNSDEISILKDKIEKQQKQIDELLTTQQLTIAKNNELVNKLLDRITELSRKN
jgi:hypothetical protein